MAETLITIRLKSPMTVIGIPMSQPNPQENVWDEMHEKEFSNCVFDHLDAVSTQLEHGFAPALQKLHVSC